MKKTKLIISIIIMLLCISTAIYSLYNIILWMEDNTKIHQQIKLINDAVNTKDAEDTSLDFQKLELMNNEVVGWLIVPGTNIDYPILQHSDNSYYLTHAFDKSYNNAGWPFLDYRNDINDLDMNTIIYAHGRLDKTMFGSLREVLTDEWLANKENAIIKLETPYNEYKFEVFSAYHIKTTDDYIEMSFNDGKEYKDFIKLISDRSVHKFTTEITDTDKILTLSTCYNEWEKMVVHAKLISNDKKY